MSAAFPSEDWPLPSTTLTTVQADLAAYQAAHPQATFAELEAAVEGGVARLRASLLRAVLPTDAGAVGATRPRCPACGIPRVARGRQRRLIHVWGDQMVPVERTYWTCPRCGDGHFPPG